MDYAALRTLIETHPTHGATSDEDMLIWLNDATGVTRDRVTLPATEIMESILSNTTEWLAMSADEREITDMIMKHYVDVPVQTGTRTRTVLVAILGTTTKAELAGKIPESVSRADDGGFGIVNLGDVQNGRVG